MRIIPKKTKVKVEFYRNISIVDMLIAAVGLVLEILLLLTNFGFLSYLLMVAVLGIFVCLYLPVDGEKLYMQIVGLVKFLISRKKYEAGAADARAEISSILPYRGISGGLIEYEGYYAGVLEIMPKEFRLLSEYKQSEIIDKAFASVIKSITGKTYASLVKIDRPIILDSYVKQEQEKKLALDKTLESGGIEYAESVTRKNIIDNRAAILETLNKESIVYKSGYYFVVYDESPSVISEIIQNATERFSE